MEVLDNPARCNYCTYMNTATLKITRIGNSRGVRLPAATLRRYHLDDEVVMEERSEGILLRPTGIPAVKKLSWEETAKAMVASGEDWSEWEVTAADGLAEIPWDDKKPSRVAEQQGQYRVPKASAKKR